MNCNSIESSGWGQHPKWMKCKRSQTMEHFDSGCPVRQRWNSERWDSQSLTDLNSIFNCKNVITWHSWIVRFNLNKRLTNMLKKKKKNPTISRVCGRKSTISRENFPTNLLLFRTREISKGVHQLKYVMPSIKNFDVLWFSINNRSIRYHNKDS